MYFFSYVCYFSYIFSFNTTRGSSKANNVPKISERFLSMSYSSLIAFLISEAILPIPDNISKNTAIRFLYC